MARDTLPYLTSNIIKARHPIDKEANNALDNSTDGATCSFKVYDPAKDEAISIAEASGQTVLSVTNAGVFSVGDTAEVEHDDGTFIISAISSIDSAAGTITISSALTDTAAVGNRVRRIFGSAVPMSEYGTASINTLDWGFRGTLLSNHACQIRDQDVDIEITFIGSSTPGVLNVVEILCMTVREVSDCSA